MKKKTKNNVNKVVSGILATSILTSQFAGTMAMAGVMPVVPPDATMTDVKPETLATPKAPDLITEKLPDVAVADPNETVPVSEAVPVNDCSCVEYDAVAGHTNPECSQFKAIVTETVALFGLVTGTFTAVPVEGDASCEEYNASVAAAKAAITALDKLNPETKGAVVSSVTEDKIAYARSLISLVTPVPEKAAPQEDVKPVAPTEENSKTAPLAAGFEELGGARTEYVAGSEKKIEIIANDAPRTYGEPYIPNGITFKCYGISENAGFDPAVVFSNIPITMSTVGAEVQDGKTPAGKYTQKIIAGGNSVTFNGETYIVTGLEANEIVVSQRQITVTATDATKNYGEDDPYFDYSKTGLVNGDKLNGKLTRTHNGDKTEQVGTYDIIRDDEFGNANYTIKYVGAKLTIGRQTLTITGKTKDGSTSRQYGDKNPELDYDIVGLRKGETVNTPSNGDKNLGTIEVKCTANSESKPADYTITASGLGNPLKNYNVVHTNGSLTVKPRDITIATPSLSKKYGETDPAIVTHITAPQSANKDKPTMGWDGKQLQPLVGTLTRAPGEDVGNYPIESSYLALSNPCYNISYAPAFLTINQIPLKVSVDAATKVYGNDNPTFTVKYKGFISKDDDSCLSGELKFSTPANKTSDVGLYDVTASGYDNTKNYNISYEGAKLDVTPRPLNVAAESKAKNYGDKDPALTYITSEPLIKTGDLIGKLSRDEGEDAGKYKINQGTVAGSNYDIDYTPADFTISESVLNINIENATKVYGSDNPEFKFSITGLTNGDDEAAIRSQIQLTSVATKNSGVGSYDIVAKTTNKNYTLNVNKASLTITPAQLTAKVDDSEKLYSAENPKFSVSYSGFVLGEKENVLKEKVTFDTLATKDSNKGQYKVSASSALLDGNYQISYQDGYLNVKAKPITITADVQSKVYGNADPVFIYKPSETPLKDTDLTGLLSRKPGEDVGSYEILIGELKSSNYDIQYVSNNLAITQKGLNINIQNVSRPYGSPNPVFDYELSGLVNGDNEKELRQKIVVSTTADSKSNVGKYDITASITDKNYTLLDNKGTLTVTQLPITITVDDAKKVYGEKDPKFSYKASIDIIDPEGSPIKVELKRSNTELVGIHETSGDFTNSNYVITVKKGKFEITKRPITVIADDKTSEYGDATVELTYKLECSLGKALVFGDKLTGELKINPDKATDAGQYPIISTLGNPNYEITYDEGIYSVEVALITTEFKPAVKYYGTETKASELEYKGWKYDDSVSLLQRIFNFFTAKHVVLPDVKIDIADEVAGIKGFAPDNDQEKVVYEKAFSYPGATEGNYKYSDATGNLEVVRLPIDGTMYSINGSVKSTNVYDSDVTIKATPGYTISSSDALENNSWSDCIKVSGDSAHNIKFFVKRTADGAITNSKTSSFRIDTYVDPVTGQTIVVNNPRTGVNFFKANFLLIMSTIAGLGAIATGFILKLRKKKPTSKK